MVNHGDGETEKEIQRVRRKTDTQMARQRDSKMERDRERGGERGKPRDSDGEAERLREEAGWLFLFFLSSDDVQESALRPGLK